MLRINHIINPVDAPANTELALVQPVTFASLVRARDYASRKADIRLLSAQYPDEKSIVPSDFIQISALEKSIRDFVSSSKRRLPLLREILEQAYTFSECDYIVFSNADIAVTPAFYTMILEYVSKGYDAFAINRRRIASRFQGERNLDVLYSEVGLPHPGFDVFVFRASLFRKFTLGNVCVGLPCVDISLLHNLIAHANDFRLFTGKHLTFHIGTELVKSWGTDEESTFNRQEAFKVVRLLEPHYRIEAFPGSSLPLLKRHFKWLMNPNFSYPLMAKLDFQQRNAKRRAIDSRAAERDGNIREWLARKINFPDDY